MSRLIIYFSLEIVDLILPLYLRFSRYFSSCLELQTLVTLFELLGQEVTKKLRDINIKEESEVFLLKDNLKKLESQWKSVQSQILQKLAGLGSSKESSQSEQKKLNLLLIIRFQIQMLMMAGNVLKEPTDRALDRLRTFNDSLTQSLSVNMIRYLQMEKFSHREQEKSAIINELATDTPAPTPEINELYDTKLKLYWLEVGALSTNMIQKSKHKRIEIAARQISMNAILNMQNSKKTYKEFVEFGESFSSYYERYFSEGDIFDNPVEVLRNFGRLVYVFLRGFSIPSRPAMEDLRITFNHLFKIFQFHIIIPKVSRLLRKLVESAEDGLFSDAFSNPNHSSEFLVLIYQVYRIITFAMNALEVDVFLPFCDMMKVLFYLASLVLRPNWRFVRLMRFIHFLMHKSSDKSLKAHQFGFDGELKLFLTLRSMNFLKSDTCKEVRAFEIEKEIAQIYRCMYCSLF